MVNSQAGNLGGVVAISAPSQTKAVKARLLDGADHYDELAAKADRTGAEAEKS
jgi:hypothetical protein